MKKGLLIALCLIFVPSWVFARQRGMSNPKAVFIEKGTWSAGLSMGWNSWDARGDDGVDLIGVVTGLKGSVNIFDISASGSRFVKDNLSVGLRVGLSDARVDLDSTQFLGNEERDRHLMREVLKGSLTCRQYLPLFVGRLIALFLMDALTDRPDSTRTTTGRLVERRAHTPLWEAFRSDSIPA